MENAFRPAGLCLPNPQSYQLQGSVQKEPPFPLSSPSSFSLYSFNISTCDICHSYASCSFPQMHPMLGALIPRVGCVSYNKSPLSGDT